MRKARRRLQAEPWDLFHPRPATPAWEELPQPVVRRVRELLARLLQEQRERQALRGSGQEVSHDE